MASILKAETHPDDKKNGLVFKGYIDCYDGCPVYFRLLFGRASVLDGYLMYKKYVLLIGIIFVTGCSIASINKMKRSSSEIDFDYIEKSHDASSGLIWTWKGKNEYFLYAEKSNEDDLKKELKKAAIEHGFAVVFESEDGKAILGERSIRLNEWNSVLGMYISTGEDYDRVYLKVEITQDITGGWMSNRAKAIGETFCSNTDLCNVNITNKST